MSEYLITEDLPLMDYITTEKVQSKIDPDRIVDVISGFRCPRCKEQHLGNVQTNFKVICSCGVQIIGGTSNKIRCEANTPCKAAEIPMKPLEVSDYDAGL